MNRVIINCVFCGNTCDVCYDPSPLVSFGNCCKICYIQLVLPPPERRKMDDKKEKRNKYMKTYMRAKNQKKSDSKMSKKK